MKSGSINFIAGMETAVHAVKLVQVHMSLWVIARHRVIHDDIMIYTDHQPHVHRC